MWLLFQSSCVIMLIEPYTTYREFKSFVVEGWGLGAVWFWAEGLRCEAEGFGWRCVAALPVVECDPVTGSTAHQTSWSQGAWVR